MAARLAGGARQAGTAPAPGARAWASKGSPVWRGTQARPHPASITIPPAAASVQLLIGSVLEGLGLPVPAELLLATAPAAGLTAGPALALATGGYLLGAAGAYWGGRQGGARALERIARLGGMSQAQGDRLGALFRRWGPLMGLIARFLPPVRAASLWAAGALQVDPRRYFPAVALSTLVYNALWLVAGLSVAPLLQRAMTWIAPVSGAILLTLLFFRLLRTRQGRGGLW